jgi:hypothetical protein
MLLISCPVGAPDWGDLEHSGLLFRHVAYLRHDVHSKIFLTEFSYKQRNKSWSTNQSSIFWGVTLCSLVEFYQHFGGIYCLYLQRQKVTQVRIGLMLLGC